MSSRILIVEDDSAIANLLEINLKVAGYETAKAADGNTAETLLLENECFDLALLDIMLPGKDGFELLPQFHERRIPVIFLTAKDDIFSKVAGLKSGAEDYIVKPFEILELLVRVEKVLDYSLGLDGLPKSDVLKFLLEGGCSLVVRPSGTEPKLKLYLSVTAEDAQAAAAIETNILAEAGQYFA